MLEKIRQKIKADAANREQKRRILYRRMSEDNTNKRDRYKARIKYLMLRGQKYEKTLNRLMECSPRFRCHHFLCYDCNTLLSSERDRHKLSPKHMGGVARSPKKRKRQLVQERFRMAPDEQLGALTLHMSVVEIDPDKVKEAIKKSKRKLRYVLNEEFPLCLLDGSFEILPKRISNIDDNCYGHSKFRLEHDEGAIEGMLHMHAVIWCAGYTREDIRTKLEKHFPGSKQVRVGAIQHKMNDSGKDAMGIGGYAEYAAKRYIKLDLDEDNPKAFARMVDVYDAVSRNTTNFRCGPKLTHEERMEWFFWDWCVDDNGDLVPVRLESQMTRDEIIQDMEDDYHLNISTMIDYDSLVHHG